MLNMNNKDTVRLGLELFLPLQEECSRNDDQGRTVSAPLIWLVYNHGGNHLDSLAETHLVGEDATLVMRIAFLIYHPADPNELMREKLDCNARYVTVNAAKTLAHFSCPYKPEARGGWHL